MKRSVVLFALVVALVSGCQGEAPPIPALSPKGVEPTPTPLLAEPSLTAEKTPIPSSLGKARVLEALAGYQEASDARELADALRSLADGIAIYLAKSLDARPLSDQVEPLEELQAILAEGSPGAQPQVRAADLDHQEMVLVESDLEGAPIFAFCRQGEAFTAYDLPPDFRPTSQEEPWLAAGDLNLERVSDINGDGQTEVVITHFVLSGSAERTRLMVFRWGEEGFEALFDRSLDAWAGPASWELSPAADQEEIKLSYATMGVHDHKLLPHPTVTELWRWDGTEYIMVSYTQSAPQTQRQQFNLAEVAFQRRDYEAAIAAYEKVFQDPHLLVEEETAEVDWAALAHFRLGQCYAFLGQEDRARQELAIAEGAGSALGEMARVFSDAYRPPDEVARAWGALQALGLYQRAYEGQAGNLGFPVDIFYLLFPGAGVAAYLDNHPKVLEGSGDALVSALGSLGLPVKEAAIADLDGEGEKEVVFVTEDRWIQHAWLAYRGGDRWLLDIAEEGEDLALGQVVAVAGGPRQAVTVRLPEEYQPSLVYVTWDGEKPIRLSDARWGEVLSQGSLLFPQAPLDYLP